MNKNFKKAIKNGVVRDFFKLMKPYTRTVIFLFVFIVIIEAIKMIGPYILKLLIDGLYSFSTDKLNYFIFLIIFFFFSLLVVSILDYFKDSKIFSILLKAEYDIPIRCQKKLLELDLAYHQKEETGNKVTKIERGIFKFTDLLGTIFWELLPVLFQIIYTSIIFIIIDYRFFVILIIFSFILIYLNIKINKNIYPTRKLRYKSYEQAAGKMVQSIINVNTVQSFSQQQKEVEEYSSLKNNILKAENKEWFYILKFANLREILVGLGRVLFLFFGIFLAVKNQISIGTVVWTITLSEKSFSTLSRAFRLYDRFVEGAEGINRVSELLKTESAILNNGQIKLKKVDGLIDFKNVKFAYQEDNTILDNINLNIPADSITALVGPSGGGKTTIARLIFRHFDPVSGRVLLDGHDLRKLELFNLRSYLSIVPQDVEVFNSSIADNIAYSKKEISLAEVKAAAKIANIDKFIESLPDKYQSLVGERGVKLSGGQRQRIGIARAVLANPKVLIFDEATSNLDAESERLIQNAILKVSKNKTIIIIAHRLSTIKMADKIIVIENGKVVEEGMHLQLMNQKNGLYRKLVDLQSLGEISKD